MINTGDDQIDQVIQRHEATLVVDSAERKGNAFVQPTHHGQKMGLYPGAIHQRWADDDHLHARVCASVPIVSECADRYIGWYS